MADIFPFHGVRYNEELVKDFATVVCPPYDVISPQQEAELYKASKHNFIRIEQGRQTPQDTDEDNKYTRAAVSFEKWLEQGVLTKDDKSAIYLHEHTFKWQGKSYSRRGIFARVRLEEWDAMVVRPHESTMTVAKQDRMMLLAALKANTSPVFCLYEDAESKIKGLLDGQAGNAAEMSFTESNGESHRIWAITDETALAALTASFKEKPLYIADGHHRYETALTYRRQRRASSPADSSDAPYNFVMMSLVGFSDPGLLILPPHRLLRGLSKPKLDALPDKLELFFDVKKLSLKDSAVWQEVDSLFAEKGKTRLIVCGLNESELLMLTLKDPVAAGKMMPCFHSDAYKRLDVSVVDHVILEELLETSSGEETRIDYNYNRLETVQSVADGEYQLAFILKPLAAEVIKEIADAGDRMPRKSTYFYPKPPSGLLLYSLD